MKFNIWNINECLKFDSFETAYNIIYQNIDNFTNNLKNNNKLELSFLNQETNFVIDITMWKSFNLINVIIKESKTHDISSNQ